MDVRLVVAIPSKPRKSYAVRLPIVVGRGEEAKFRIPQDSVSRQHCRFSLEDGVVCVTDLGSTNGTLVSGTRITAHAATPVSPGTEVRIGGIVLVVEYKQAATAGRAAPPAAAAAAVETTTLPVLEPLEHATVSVPAAAPAVPDVGDQPAATAAPAFPDVVDPPAATDAQAFPDVAEPPAAGDVQAFPDVEAAPAAADGSFDFLGAEAEPPAPADDDNLNDFFKSLS